MLDEDKTQLPKESDGRSASTLTAGQSFGPYRIVRLLGRGGMGEVYEAEHQDLHTKHALKLISPEVVERSDSKERFKREARVMARLRHPNIVHVDDFGELDGRIWLRMDLVEGSVCEGSDLDGKRVASLVDLLSTGEPLPEALVRNLLEQILSGLGFAHGEGAVHRDIKPANILLQSNSQKPGSLIPKITDFGLVSLVGAEWIQSQVQLTVARSMADPDATRLESGSSGNGTSTQALLGTFAYMSPEQKKGVEVDHRSDLYAVGLIGFQMLTGDETPGFEMPSDLVPDLDPGWDDWVKEALASRKERRFESADKMMAALPGSAVCANTLESGFNKLEERITGESPPPAPNFKKPAAPVAPAPAKPQTPAIGKDHTIILSEDQELELKWIEPGEFTMGSPEKIVEGGFLGFGETVKQAGEPGRDSCEQQHSVTLSQGYWLGKYTVTQGQWESVMGSNPSEFKGRDLPVDKVSWEDAMSFCRKLTERERSAGRLAAGYEYTLPSEAQWEYACRAGTTGAYAGDLDSMGWYDKNSGNKTHAVGTKRANGWGLYDMHGNVWEWCSDWYGAYPSGYVVDPTGASSGPHRVLRGGGWLHDASSCRSAFRDRFGPGSRDCDLGFRLVHRSVQD